MKSVGKFGWAGVTAAAATKGPSPVASHAERRLFSDRHSTRSGPEAGPAEELRKGLASAEQIARILRDQLPPEENDG